MRRFLAGLIDLLAGFGLCYLLHWRVGLYFTRRALVALHAGAPDTFWKGTIPWLMGLAGPFIYTLPLAFLLISLPEIWGWSLGKKFVGLSIASGNGRSGLLIRFLIKTVGFWGITLALVTGSRWLIVLSFFLGCIILLLSPTRLLNRLSKTEIV
ncbi:MAG: RDD family protein [bacterium]